MFSLLSGIWTEWTSVGQYRVLLVGPTLSGKSAIICRLKDAQSPLPALQPTIGMNMALVDGAAAAGTHGKGGCQFKFWDLGGGDCLARIWPSYFRDCHGIMFVIDASCEHSIGAGISCLLQNVLCRTAQHTKGLQNTGGSTTSIECNLNDVSSNPIDSAHIVDSPSAGNCKDPRGSKIETCFDDATASHNGAAGSDVNVQDEGSEERQVLMELLFDGMPLLIILNKIDLIAETEVEVQDLLAQLKDRLNHILEDYNLACYHIFMCSASTGEGVHDAYTWLCESIQRNGKNLAPIYE